MSRQSWPRNAGGSVDVCVAAIVLINVWNNHDRCHHKWRLNVPDDVVYTEHHLPNSRAIALNISMDSISISSPSLL